MNAIKRLKQFYIKTLISKRNEEKQNGLDWGPAGKPDVLKFMLVRAMVMWEKRAPGLQQLKARHFNIR
jgi:hypothetical protein